MIGYNAFDTVQEAINAANLMTNFDESSLDSRVGLDVPNAALGNITFDAANDELDFNALGNTDMWGSRNNAPIAWADRPAVSAGETWAVETEVRMNNTGQNAQQAGITFYADSDGSEARLHLRARQLESANRHIHLQGLGDNNPNVEAGVAVVRQQRVPAGRGDRERGHRYVQLLLQGQRRRRLDPDGRRRDQLPIEL